jgi:NADH-quinone oxidoreductase subunit M
LLKLGGYGLVRVIDRFVLLIGGLRSWMISLIMLGMVYVGVMCCRLNDMKALVAYSSVAHIGLVIVGVYILNI